MYTEYQVKIMVRPIGSNIYVSTTHDYLNENEAKSFARHMKSVLKNMGADHQILFTRIDKTTWKI